MYQKEVLSKFPAIQHVFFGSIFTLTPVNPGTRLPQARLGMGPGAAAAGGDHSSHPPDHHHPPSDHHEMLPPMLIPSKQ